MKKNTVKNICYILILALVLTGALFSFTNCSNNTAIENTNKSTTANLKETENLTSETDSAMEATTEEPVSTDILPYNKLSIDSNSIVGIAQSDKANATDLTFDDIKELIRKAVELAGGLDGIIKDGDTVVLKPNLVTGNDYTLPNWQGKPLTTEVNGNCTDYRVVKAVAQLVREINPSGKIYVMEGSAQDTAKVMKALNYTKEFIPEVDEFLPIESDSGKYGDKDSDGLVRVVYQNGLLHKEYYLNKKIYEADALICLPTLKNHWDAVVTGSIKNIGIGATPSTVYGIDKNNNGRNSMVDHSTADFHKWIADFYTCRPADFTIMDALQGLENGPTPCYAMNGCTDIKDSQKNLRCILASKDALALDTVETNIINWDIDSVGYLKHLTEAGKVGNGNTKNITVLGVKVDDIRSDFAGNIPSAGGAKLTKKTPPSIKIESVSFDGNNLKLKLNISDDTDKLDIYIDGVYAGSVNSNMNDITFDAERFDKGLHEITVYSYDHYMNHAEASATAEKQTEKTITGLYNYTAPFAETVPVIDGKSDDPAWKKAEWNPIDQVWLGNIPNSNVYSGRYKMVWTEDRLYYLVEIVDNYISTTRSDTPLVDYYKDDCLELFIDENHSGGDHERNYNAFAYHMSFGGVNVVDLNTKGQAQLYNDHLNYKINQNGTTYTWEVEMKVFDDKYDETSDKNVPVKLYAGKELGFAIAYCDADETNDRERFIGSVNIPGENKNVAWQNASVFAKLTLAK